MSEQTPGPPPIRVVMTLTGHRCFRCDGRLDHLEPAIHGWRYYCRPCRHLTAPASELAKAMREKGPDAIGIVVAIPCRLDYDEEKEQA